MQKLRKYFLYSLIYLFLVFNITKITAQAVLFETKIHNSPTEFSKFLSSINSDENQLYFIANDYNLYCIDKTTFELKYKKELNSKTNTTLYLYKNTLITSLYEDKKHRAVVLNKNTGEIIQKLSIPPLKTNPHFINDSIFISTIIDDEGGQLVSYDLKNDQVLWNHFVGHGADKCLYIQDESILANFDYDEWKAITLDGEIKEEIFEEYETNKKMKLLHVFFMLSHDTIEITREYMASYFSNPENVKAKTNESTTVFLDSKKLVVLADDLKVISNVDFNNTLKEHKDFDNEYLEILKIDNENVWFFYQNRVVNYDFKKNKVAKIYDVAKWNAHQAILEANILWLISKNDGQLYGLQLETSQKELDEKTVKENQYRCSKPDKARIEAEKEAEEKYKQ